ncbi:MAG: hypothetical protein ACI4Q3_01050 [Kiritimatiellia bacterium]
MEKSVLSRVFFASSAAAGAVVGKVPAGRDGIRLTPEKVWWRF